MPKQPSKIKLSGLSGTTSKTPAPKEKTPQPDGAELTTSKPPLLPGGPLLWCLVGLAIGLAVWLGGRSYLKKVLANQLVSTSSEEVALQSIDALLRLDANATIEVSRGLAHPEFMVANAAFRALGGQLDAWTKLDPQDRLLRMQKIVAELERIPDDMDQDHRILVSGLASRIYADTLSSREVGAGDVLEACRRILSRTDPEHVPTRLARLDGNSQPAPLPLPASGLPAPGLPAMGRDADSNREASPVPPPLAPLKAKDESATETQPTYTDRESARQVEQARVSPPTNQSATQSPKRLSTARMSVSDAATDEPQGQMHLTSGANSLPQSSASRSTAGAMPKLRTQESLDPLSTSASSRSRVIPSDVEPLPGATNAPEPQVALDGMEQMSIDQLVRLLASVQPRVSQAAALMLRQKGMTEANLELAIRLATGSAEVRQELLSELVNRDDLDARPWLLWMAAEGEETVRQQSVALLMPLVDNDVRRQLRILLNKERDEKVAQTIRQVLNSDKKMK